MLSSGIKKKYTNKHQNEPETQKCGVITGKENDKFVLFNTKTNTCMKVCMHTH